MNEHTVLLRNEDSLLLIVDMQEAMLKTCVEADRVQRNASILVEIAQIFDIPIIFTEQNPKKLGNFLTALLSKASDSHVIAKMEFSCFENETARRTIAATDRKTIILSGIEAHVCILQTGVQGLQSGYRVHVIADAVTSSSQMNRKIGLRRLGRAGGVISSMEMVIFELLKQAGTQEFRRALPLIKVIER